MKFRDFLKDNFKSQADYVEYGFGQVEPNHLSAQRTGQIYAQLPAAPEITQLEQGQFVKYDYAANGNGIGQVNFTGAGEWMLVYNEIKLYRNHFDGTKQHDCEFAMIKDEYQARVYSPYDYEHPEIEYGGRFWNGVDETGKDYQIVDQYVALDQGGKTVTIAGDVYDVKDNKFTYNTVEYNIDPNTKTSKEKVPVKYSYDKVLSDYVDPYEWNWTNDPYKKLGIYHEKKMPAGTAMVPRVLKTNVGDHYTTNMIKEKVGSLEIGNILYVGEKGILTKTKAEASDSFAGSGDMEWQVVKLYTMPDGQAGVKVLRIK